MSDASAGPEGVDWRPDRVGDVELLDHVDEAECLPVPMLLCGRAGHAQASRRGPSRCRDEMLRMRRPAGQALAWLAAHSALVAALSWPPICTTPEMTLIAAFLLCTLGVRARARADVLAASQESVAANTRHVSST
jgi:hypothetical protein